MTPPAAALAFDLDPAPMTIVSDLLGQIDIAPEELFHFEHGLFGFPDCHQFALLRAERPGLFWLQNVELSALTYLLVDPFVHFEGYRVDLSNGDQRDLAVSAPEEVLVLAIATLPASREDQPTANLQGPVAFNLASRLGKQIVLEQEDFGTRCAFALE